MKKFRDWNKFRREPKYIQVAILLSIVFVSGIGLLFSIYMFINHMGVISIIPFLGFLLMAFEDVEK